MKKRTIVERAGWVQVSAVRNDHIYEIKSTYILQPGPGVADRGCRAAFASTSRARSDGNC